MSFEWKSGPEFVIRDPITSVITITQPSDSFLVCCTWKGVFIIFVDQARNKKTEPIFVPFPEDRLNFYIFESQERVYLLSANGSLYKLLFTKSSNISDGSSNNLFGSGSGSTSEDIYSWFKMDFGLSGVLTVTGTSNGFAAICKDDSSIFLTIVDLSERVRIKSTVRLSDSTKESSAKWNIFSHPQDSMDQSFARTLFGEFSLVMQDILFLSTPGGILSVFPVLPKTTSFQPVPVHYDLNQIHSVLTSSSKNMFIFVFKNGKIAFWSFNTHNNEIEYKNVFLSTSIVSFVFYHMGEKFILLWSDGNKSYFTVPLSFQNLKNKELVLGLRGITHIFQIGDLLFALTVNNTVYELSYKYDNISHFSNDEASKLLKNISKLSIEYDIAKTELDSVNSALNALHCEQVDPLLLKLSYGDGKIILVNESDKIFSKAIWDVEISCHGNFKYFVKKFPLEEDLCFGNVFESSLDYFNETCHHPPDEFKVVLIGLADNDGRFLRLNVGTVSTT